LLLLDIPNPNFNWPKVISSLAHARDSLIVSFVTRLLPFDFVKNDFAFLNKSILLFFISL